MLAFDEQAVLKQAQQGYGELTQKGAVRVRFYLHAVRDDLQTKKNGYPVFNDVPYIEIKSVERDADFVSRPMKPEDPMAHPTEWALFQGWLKEPKTHVLKLPRLRPSEALLLEASDISTIEDLAATASVRYGENTHLVESIPALAALRERAVIWLGSAPETVKEAPAAAPGELDELKAQLASMQAEMTRRKGGRPKKASHGKDTQGTAGSGQ